VDELTDCNRRSQVEEEGLRWKIGKNVEVRKAGNKIRGERYKGDAQDPLGKAQGGGRGEGVRTSVTGWERQGQENKLLWQPRPERKHPEVRCYWRLANFHGDVETTKKNPHTRIEEGGGNVSPEGALKFLSPQNEETQKEDIDR